MFFSSWSSLLRIVAVGIPAYLSLIFLLRMSGKRTLSKFNAFDFIVTVAFGSILAAALLNRNLAVVDVVAAFTLLVVLQFLVSWSAIRWSWMDDLVKSEPRLLYHNGDFLEKAMKNERVTRGEILAAIRSHGIAAPEQAESVVLETDGSISVVSSGPAGDTAPGAIHSLPGGPPGGPDEP